MLDAQGVAQAITEEDREKVRRVAHGPKGAAGYLSAQCVQRIAGELELLAADADVAQLKDLATQLEAEVTRCKSCEVPSTDTRLAAREAEPKERPCAF